MTRTVCLTVDAEPDCPPYLRGWRGMEEGAPRLLDLFEGEGVPATFFTTGDTARRYPEFVERVAADGHELASHGMTHRPFPTLSAAEAEAEIREASAVLRDYAPVTAFRAPNLRMPDRYLPLLEADGYRVDSSRGKYKPAHWRPSAPTSLTRIPASVTSSWLRLPTPLRDPMLRRLSSPAVLFVHPWELVDLRDAPIPWDCRAGTGPAALESLRQVVRLFKSLGARFLLISEAAITASRDGVP
jgi:peptidoglycan/xylan/chitin deacetylase (PgdA/CDA1 family)